MNGGKENRIMIDESRKRKLSPFPRPSPFPRRDMAPSVTIMHEHGFEPLNILTMLNITAYRPIDTAERRYGRSNMRQAANTIYAIIYLYRNIVHENNYIKGSYKPHDRNLLIPVHAAVSAPSPIHPSLTRLQMQRVNSRGRSQEDQEGTDGAGRTGKRTSRGRET